MDEQPQHEPDRREAGQQPEPRIIRLLTEHGRAAWMLIGLIVAAGLLGYVFFQIRLILLAVFVALVVAAVVTPAARWLEARGVSRTLATATGLLLVTTLLVGIVGGVTYRLVEQVPQVVAEVQDRRGDLIDLVGRPPVSLSEKEVEALLERSVREVTPDEGEDAADGDAGSASAQSEQEEVSDGEGLSPTTALALLRGSAATLQVLGFIGVGIVLSFFVVRDRDLIARGVVRHLAGGEHDQRAREVLASAWRALDGYVRASVTIGAIEGAVIGAALVLVGTPLAGSLAIITFLAAFVPVVGATVAGALAVLLTWVGVGTAQALVVAVVVLVVQQVDSNILQPRLVSEHTVLHPIATILALLVGGLVGGVLGALLAVPAAAVLTAVASELLAPDPIEGPVAS